MPDRGSGAQNDDQVGIRSAGSRAEGSSQQSGSHHHRSEHWPALQSRSARMTPRIQSLLSQRTSERAPLGCRTGPVSWASQIHWEPSSTAAWPLGCLVKDDPMPLVSQQA